MNGKITLTVLISIFVGIGIFYSGITWYQDTFNPTIIWTESVTDKFDMNQKKIFLIGNSHIGSINPDYVEKKIKQDGYNYKIFNLSIGGDNPQKRENIINSIIELKPDLIIYGIDFRSFERNSSGQEIQAIGSSEIDKIEKILPSFQDFFDQISSPIKNNEIFSNIPQSPKLITLRIMNHLVYGSEELKRLDLDSQRPLITDEAVGIKAMNNTELKKWIDERRIFKGINQLDKNLQLNSLENILQELKEKKIKTVIFTSPHHQTYLDYLSNEDKETFKIMLNYIIQKYSIEIYQLDEKYKNLEIFANPTHVAVEKSNYYSNDIVEIIKKELDR